MKPSRHSASLPRARTEQFIALLLLMTYAPGCNQPNAKSRARADKAEVSQGAGASDTARRADHSRKGLIVVLGSSTAAGTGPKDPKNAWVSRYQAHLATQYPNVTLVNLAVGGYT